MCMVESCGEGIAMVSGNVGSGIVGCGDGGGVLRFRWLVIAVSIISTAVSSMAVIVGEDTGVVMVVVEERDILFVLFLPFFLYVFGCSISHRM